MNTGAICRGAAETGKKLSTKQLLKLRSILKKAGLLGLGLSVLDAIIHGEDAIGAMLEPFDPLGPIKGDISGADMIPECQGRCSEP